MSDKLIITDRLEKISKNSEEKGTLYFEKSKEDPENIEHLKAMIACYRASISSTLTALKVQILTNYKK